MGLREFFLWQLEHEVETSRKVIERVPEGQQQLEAARALNGAGLSGRPGSLDARLGRVHGQPS